MKMRKFKKGFTLVELVVVIAVIAVLAAVSVGAYFGVTDSANSSNATAAYKQIKDLWTMYSVDGYKDHWSAERNAKEFCLKYVEEYGPDYYVNYTIVSIDSVETETSNAAGRNDSNDSAILFTIDTKYPTWFIVSDLVIVEEGPVSKSITEFNTSLNESSRISEEDKARITKEDFSFDIETIRIDPVTGRKVRGFKYYEITVNDVKSGDQTYDDVFYIRPGESIYSHDRPQYALGEINTNSQFWGYTFAIKDGYNEISPSESINLEEDCENAEKIESNDEVAFGYKVASHEYSYVSNDNLNTSDYAFVLARATKFDSAPYLSLVENFNLLLVETEKKTEYYGASGVTLNYIQNQDFLTSSEYERISSEADNSQFTYFIFVNNKNARISSNVKISNNIALVVGHYDNASKMTEMISRSIVKTAVSERTRGLFWWGEWSTPVVSENYFGTNFYDIGNPSITSWEEQHAAADINSIPNPYKHYSFYESTNEYDFVKSRLTIDKSGTLNIAPGGYLCVDGFMYYPTADTILTVKDRGEIINNGTINIGDDTNNENIAKMRTISEIKGTGKIIAKQNAELLDIIKFRDFFGGTHASTCIGEGLFPYNDLVLDNVKCQIEFHYGSEYNVRSGIFMSSLYFQTSNIKFIGSDNNTLFKMSNDCVLTKIADDSGLSTYTIKSGTLSDGNLSANFNVIKTKNTGTTDSFAELLQSAGIDTSETNLPISNTKLVVEKDAVLSLQTERKQGCAIELLPTSKILVNEGGLLNIASKSRAAVITPQVYKQYMDLKNNDIKYESYSDVDGVLFEKFALLNEQDDLKMFDIEGNLNIEDAYFAINADGVEVLDDNTTRNIYKFVSIDNLNDGEKISIRGLEGVYNYRYLAGEHAGDNPYNSVESISINSFAPFVY